jgi:hypothetical protein
MRPAAGGRDVLFDGRIGGGGVSSMPAFLLFAVAFALVFLCVHHSSRRKHFMGLLRRHALGAKLLPTVAGEMTHKERTR